MENIEAPVGRTAVMYHRPASDSYRFLFPVRSALIYILFLVIGLFVYRALEPVIGAFSCRTAENFCATVSARPTDISAWLRAATDMLTEEWLLFGLTFLFTFSYFCDFLTSVLLAYRALLLGIAFGYMEALMRRGACGAPLLSAFLIYEACLSALFLVFACRSAFLCARLCQGTSREWFLSVRLAAAHALRTLFCMCMLYALLSLCMYILS